MFQAGGYWLVYIHTTWSGNEGFYYSIRTLPISPLPLVLVVFWNVRISKLPFQRGFLTFSKPRRMLWVPFHTQPPSLVTTLHREHVLAIVLILAISPSFRSRMS